MAVMSHAAVKPATETVAQTKMRSSRKPWGGPLITQMPARWTAGMRTAIAMAKRRNPRLWLRGWRDAITEVMESMRSSVRWNIPACQAGDVRRSNRHTFSRKLIRSMATAPMGIITANMDHPRSPSSQDLMPFTYPG